MGKQTNYSPTFPMYPAGAVAVTPNDSTNLADPAIIYTGSGGNIKVTTTNGDVVTFTGVLGGSYLAVQVLRVWANGTTATGLVAIY